MIQKILDFFSSISESTWQDVVLSSFFIPFFFYLATKLRTWIVSIRPLHLLLKGYRGSKKEILIFLSQLSGATNQFQLTQSQKYISFFPQPLPNNQNNLGQLNYQNIDPVWSQSDGQCATEIFNILGQINKHQGFKIANTINDWNERENPIFTIGFNPKTHDLINCCSPINFQIENNGLTISIDGQNIQLDAHYPNDAGILQKTFTINNTTPVFILAGLGTSGTEVAGRVLNENCVSFGKLYGTDSFSVLFKTDITRGRSNYEVKGIFPKPKLYKAIFYPMTYFKWYRKGVFPQN